MDMEHPSIQLLSRLDVTDLSSAKDVLAEDFVWHYFNPNLPEVEGDYVGIDGFKEFFAILAGETDGTFKVEPISAMPVGEELVVVRTRNTMILEDEAVAVDVVVVWRVVNGEIAEGWDIPSAFTLAD